MPKRKTLTSLQQDVLYAYLDNPRSGWSSACRKVGCSQQVLRALRHNPLAQKFIADIDEMVKSAKIATLAERKERLTEILRANLTDFVDQDGNITLKKSGAVAEYSVTTIGEVAVKRTIKLRDPVTAIAQLDREERVGVAEGVINDNRQINITEVIIERPAQ